VNVAERQRTVLDAACKEEGTSMHRRPSLSVLAWKFLRLTPQDGFKNGVERVYRFRSLLY
jgi:hypothetical protein